MKVGRAASSVKNARNEIRATQLELSFDIHESREAVSQQENGRYRVQPNIASYFAEKHNNPWVAIEAAHEYTHWGVSKLDGEAVDLHRNSTALKFKEELEEAIYAMDKAMKKLAVNPSHIQSMDLEVIERSIQESLDVITASNHYVAVICKEYGISWMKMWTQHKVKLIQRRFLKK